jgi:hypothetical protein
VAACGSCARRMRASRVSRRVLAEEGERLITVACLYIDPRGPYPKMASVECWDEARNARLYAGPHPVVAHPPCGPWGRLRHLYRGTEHDCAPIAIEQVRRWGGVLEHPAGSKLWEVYGLPAPGDYLGARGGYTIEVCQCDWGHVARKRTWLYLVGIDFQCVKYPASRQPTHWASGGRTTSSRTGTPIPPGIKVCSAQQRRRTPPAFADWLVSLARSVKHA